MNLRQLEDALDWLENHGGRTMATEPISGWRRSARLVIEETLRVLVETNPSASEKEKRQALSEAYPFGPRKHHPYKIWCNEVARALHPERYSQRGVGRIMVADLTMPMFEEDHR